MAVIKIFMSVEQVPYPSQVPTAEEYQQAIHNFYQLKQHKDVLFEKYRDEQDSAAKSNYTNEYNEANRLYYEAESVLSKMRESLLKLPNVVEYHGNIVVMEAIENEKGQKQIQIKEVIGTNDLGKIKEGAIFLADLSNAPKHFRDFMWGGPYLYREEGGQRWLDLTQKYADIPYTDRYRGLSLEDYEDPVEYSIYGKKNREFAELLNGHYPLQIIDSDGYETEINAYYAVAVINHAGKQNRVPFPLLEKMLGRKLLDSYSPMDEFESVFHKADMEAFLKSVLGDQFRGFTDGAEVLPNEIVANTSVPAEVMSILNKGFRDIRFYDYHNVQKVVFANTNTTFDVYTDRTSNNPSISESSYVADLSYTQLNDALPKSDWCVVFEDVDGANAKLQTRNIYRKEGSEFRLVAKAQRGWEDSSKEEIGRLDYNDTISQDILNQLPTELRNELRSFAASEPLQQAA